MTKKYLNTLTCILYWVIWKLLKQFVDVIIVNLNIRYKHCVAVVFIHILNFSTVRNSVRRTTKPIQSVKRCGILFITQNNNPFVPYLGILTVHTSIMTLLFLGLICWVKFSADNIHVSKYFSYFPRKQEPTFYWRQFEWNVKPCFLGLRLLFVCVEVLRPSQPKGIMSNAVS